MDNKKTTSHNDDSAKSPPENKFRSGRDLKKNVHHSPTVTVITVCYNAGDKLEKTINSVILQTYPNIEYIVIDGGSTDNTTEILQRYNNNIDLVISEPDEGITHAMNKGITYSRGDYLIFIHSGDYLLEPTGIECIAAHMTKDNPIIMCDILFGMKQKRVRAKGFNFLTHFKFRNPHQGILCAKAVFDNIGYFSNDYHVCADYHFFLRAYQMGYKAKTLPVTLAFMNDEGISSSKDQKEFFRRILEEKKIHETVGRETFIRLVYKIYWLLYMPYRKIRHRVEKAGTGKQIKHLCVLP